jgi:hypothetical protein
MQIAINWNTNPPVITGTGNVVFTDSNSVIITVQDSTLPYGFSIGSVNKADTYTWSPSASNLASKTFSVSDLTPTAAMTAIITKRNDVIAALVALNGTNVLTTTYTNTQLKDILMWCVYELGGLNNDMTLNLTVT